MPRTPTWAPPNADPNLGIYIEFASLDLSKYATTPTGGNVIIINEDYDFNMTFGANFTTAISHIITHELGHALAVDHMGDKDALMEVGHPPIMATCLNPSQVPGLYLTVEDRAYMQLAHGKYVPSAFASNTGFEDGAYTWGILPGTTVTAESSGGYVGPHDILFNAGSTSNYFYQNMTYADAPTKTIRAAASIKRVSASDTGTVSVELWTRLADYGPPKPGGCTYPNQLDMNDRPMIGPNWIRTVYSTPATPPLNWATASSPTTTSNYGGTTLLSVRIYENVTGSSAVRIDNAKIACVTQKPEGDCL